MLVARKISDTETHITVLAVIGSSNFVSERNKARQLNHQEHFIFIFYYYFQVILFASSQSFGSAKACLIFW